MVYSCVFLVDYGDSVLDNGESGLDGGESGGHSKRKHTVYCMVQFLLSLHHNALHGNAVGTDGVKSTRERGIVLAKE